jgi:hypothetical protein
MSSVINLCDSSEEEDVKDTKTRPPSDDSSSSSLDDDILYAPGIFSQSSNTSKPTIKKNDKGQGVAAAVRGMKGDGSPQKPLTIKEDYYEDRDGSPLKPAAAKKTNNYYSNFGRKREASSSRSKTAIDALQKRAKADDDDVIEIGSSSDDNESPKKPAAKKTNDNALSDYFSHPNFNNKVAKKSQVQFDSSDDDAKSEGSDHSSESVNLHNGGSDWTKSSTLNNNLSQGSATVRNPYKTNSKSTKTKESNSYSFGEGGYGFEEDSHAKQKSAAPQEKKPIENPYKRSPNPPSNESFESDSSSATVPLSDSYNEPPARPKSPPEKLLNPPKEIDLSMDTDGDDDECSDDNQLCNNAAKKDSISNKRKSVDWSFDVDGGFDEDDSESDLDTKPKARVETKPSAKVKPISNGTKSFTLKDRVDNDHVELDSDDSSNSSHMPLFTPRPFKKAKGSDTATSAVAAAAAAASFALSASKSGGGLEDSSSSPELQTPRAFSPPSVSPLTTFATKKKVPVPAIPAMPPELINEIGGKLYPDLKHSFLIALTHHARKARHAAYERGTFDAALRSIIVICLHIRPLRSPEATRRIKGVGGNLYDLLKETTAGLDGKAPFVPRQNKYSCVAAAALVALLELEEASPTSGCFSMESFISKVNELLDSRAKAALNETIEKYLDPNTLDPNWGQVKKLCSTNSNADIGGPFIKERKKKQACASGVVFELLDKGREMAIKLRDLARAPPPEPGPLRQLPNDSVDEEFGNGKSRLLLHSLCRTPIS